MGKGSRKRRHPRKRKPGGGPPVALRPARSPASASARSPRAGRISAGFFVLVLGLLPFLGGGYMLAGALGVVGHSGVFTAARCSVVGTGRGRYVACGGELAVAHRAPRQATVDTGLTLGRPTSVRVLPAGPVETVGPVATSGWATVTLGGLTVLTAGVLAAFRARLRPPVRDTVFRVLVGPAGLTLGGLVVYVVVRIAT